ncbi:MAG: PilZ domain-containing protein, partial [Bacteroidia bacterium]
MHDEKKQEHRKHQRIPLREEFLVDIRKDFKCVDISEGGLYFSTGNIFEENSFFDVTIPFQNKKVKVKAQIRHFQPGIGVG